MGNQTIISEILELLVELEIMPEAGIYQKCKSSKSQEIFTINAIGLIRIQEEYRVPISLKTTLTSQCSNKSQNY